MAGQAMRNGNRSGDGEGNGGMRRGADIGAAMWVSSTLGMMFDVFGSAESMKRSYL
jgi:hypothetical protein